MMATSAQAARATLFVDADNTLWDTDAVFAAAQLTMLATVEASEGVQAIGGDRLGFVRAVDQALAQRHHDGLRYPPRLLAQGLRLRLRGAAVEAAARKAARASEGPAGQDSERDSAAERNFFAAIATPPALRPGVEEGLAALRDAGCTVLIVTEGAEAKVARTAETLGLAGHFTRIVEGKKRPELYARVLRLTAAPLPAYMVGDQLDRDILPAKAAGLTTIYFPGGFNPSWAPDEAQAAPDYRIARFDEVVAIVLGSPAAQHGQHAG